MLIILVVFKHKKADNSEAIGKKQLKQKELSIINHNKSNKKNLFSKNRLSKISLYRNFLFKSSNLFAALPFKSVLAYHTERLKIALLEHGH